MSKQSREEPEITPWYAASCAYAQIPEEPLLLLLKALKKPIRKNQKCTLGKLALLPQFIGRALDEAQAPWDIAQYVAHGDGPAEQKRRAEVRLAELFEQRSKRKGRRVTIGSAILRSLRTGKGT